VPKLRQALRKQILPIDTYVSSDPAPKTALKGRFAYYGYYTKITSIIEAKMRFIPLIKDVNFTLYADCMVFIDKGFVHILRYFQDNRRLTTGVYFTESLNYLNCQ
jgi:hypothetical protein